MGKRSRTKGHAWEREVANRLTEATGVECKRCLVETREGNSGDIQSDLPYAVQCKVGASPNPIGAYLEAMEVALTSPPMHRGDRLPLPIEPIAIIKRNAARGKPKVEVAVISFDHLLRLLSLEQGNLDGYNLAQEHGQTAAKGSEGEREE